MAERAVTRRQFARTLAAAGGLTLVSRRAAAAEFSMRLFHNQPPESPLHLRLVEMWAAVRAETRGRVEVAVVPENNQLSDGDPNPLQMLIDGELEFYTVSGNGLSSRVPPADVQATPYAFRTPAQVYRAMDGDLGAYLRQELGARGLYAIPFGCFENGFHQITCSTKPIRTAADMQGLKIRVPGSPLFREFFSSMGAVTATMNIRRLYAALKSGLVEAQSDPVDIAELFKLYEVQKYVSMTGHSWSGYNLIANQRMWQRLPADVQRVIERHTRKFSALQRADTDALNGPRGQERLRQRGMIFNTPDIATFRAGLGPFYVRWKQAIGQRATSLLESHVGRLG